MNSCILMAEIIKEPELRFTPDGLEVTEMLVQFSGLRESEPAANLKVVGWGNMAKEIQQHYHVGDRVLLEGRLGMHTIDRPEGFKEKRAELTVQKIYPLVANLNMTGSSRTTAPVTTPPQKAVSSYEPPLSTPTPTTSNVGVASQNNYSEPVPQVSKPERSSYPPVAPNPEPDVDDIPF
ncbi:single-stranded DNA-binding protein [Fischerella thermalis CCMEE 5330]|uniref:Single-stranded DNA-binding protein n=1 Tax=Fischerella thermalis CCMEE 5330 TaxID=2019670 RepID=A0A2N6LZT1_9CYAN|nr:single-stranded DNA-binding protein [Fischerella thermalis]PMB40032.1 single-stranded DNA-binding protein [Fischerella thermalis CCMEE 5330]